MKKRISIISIATVFLYVATLFWDLSDISAKELPPGRKEPTKTDVNKKIDQLEKEVSSLSTTMKKVIRSINSLKKQASELQKSKVAEKSYKSKIISIEKAVAALDSIVKSTQNDISKIRHLMTATELRALYADSINFEILSQLVILENRILSISTSLTEYKSVSQEIPDKKFTSAVHSYREKYLQALSLHQNNQNEDSIDLFRQLIAEDMKNKLADNAQYWIGECYYSLKNYQRAIIEFEKVFSFPDSNKNDDAQFKLGLCYVAIGNREKAREEFQRLIDYFPNSEYVTRAKQFLR